MLYTVYFSPTKTTETIAKTVTDAIIEDRGYATTSVDLTSPGSRPIPLKMEKDDVLVFGFPVYGGRVPGVLVESISHLAGEGTKAIPLAVYGNRDYDDALAEIIGLLGKQGFDVIAAAAFIGEHSMAPRVAAGRPDADDIAVATQFGHDVAAGIETGISETPHVKGTYPLETLATAFNEPPKTTDACTKCGTCVVRCPMGIIDAEDPTSIADGCISCHACEKNCPENAKYFDDDHTAMVVNLLESKFMVRKEPELFLSLAR